MKIAFVVNEIETENPKYTTIGLARTATTLGHEAWLMGVGDFTYDPSGVVCGHARRTTGTFDDGLGYLDAVTSENAIIGKVPVADLDILMLRHDPAQDATRRPWAQYSPILFAQLAAREGTVVLNDPNMLANAVNKTYFQQLPEVVRPRTLITRSEKEIREFIKQHGSTILKPLQGSGGKNVFVIKEQDAANVPQIIEVISNDGYVVAQEWLPKAAEGDVRLFVMNGQPLHVGGRYAAVRRLNAEGDHRSNMHAGGKPESVEVTEEMLSIVETVRPKLVKDGMFLVGLDIVGDKLIEINVFTPGGLSTMSEMYEVDFFIPIIAALEKKTAVRTNYRRSIPNIELATL